MIGEDAGGRALRTYQVYHTLSSECSKFTTPFLSDVALSSCTAGGVGQGAARRDRGGHGVPAYHVTYTLSFGRTKFTTPFPRTYQVYYALSFGHDSLFLHRWRRGHPERTKFTTPYLSDVTLSSHTAGGVGAGAARRDRGGHGCSGSPNTPSLLHLIFRTRLSLPSVW